MKFHTVAADLGIPNHAEVTVYNLAAATAQGVMNKEFSQIILQAGYANRRFGIIFQGQIKQVKRGRESATDTYIKIYASDSEYFFNNHMIGGDVDNANALYLDRGTAFEQ